MQRIIFRTDGNTEIGMGHVVRCIALAEMLKDHFEIVFAIQNSNASIFSAIQHVTSELILLPIIPIDNNDAINFVQHVNEEDIVVLDGYDFNSEYQLQIKSKGCKLVCIEDWKTDRQFADVIINHSESIDYSNYISEYHTKIYTGFKYALLRREFLKESKPQRKLDKIEYVFISMGAADIHNLTKKFTKAVIQSEGIKVVHQMLGSVNPHLNEIKSFVESNKQVKIVNHINISALELSELLLKCDIAICPASSVALECVAIGIGLITGITANNQSGILNSLRKHEAAVDLGNFLDLPVDELKKKLHGYFTKPELFNQMIHHQGKMIDGKSSKRLLKIFEGLSKRRFRFRDAKISDSELYFKWANDYFVRSNSYNQNPIDYDNHEIWFKSKLSSAYSKLYLFVDLKNEPVGQVRIDQGEHETVIGISIDQNLRGKSYGVEMLELSTEDYLRRNSEATIIAYIKDENFASYQIFKKAGFTNEEHIVEQGVKSYKLYKKLMND